MVMQTVRVFEAINDVSLLLRQVEMYIEPGTEIMVGEAEIRCYDHKDLQAVPLSFKGKMYYILERELDPTPDPSSRTDWNQDRRVH